MSFDIKKLLPKRWTDRVALTPFHLQNQLWKFRHLIKRSTKLGKNLPLTATVKVALLILFLASLAGYFPLSSLLFVSQTYAYDGFSQGQTVVAQNLQEAFSLPHPGYLTSKFSFWHQGIDIAIGLGMPVHPIAKGKVKQVSLTLWGLGHFVVVEHEQGFTSTYGHLGKVYVQEGNEINKQSILGEVGMTGRTSGPHTHLEIAKDGKNIDPEQVLPKIDN